MLSQRLRHRIVIARQLLLDDGEATDDTVWLPIVDSEPAEVVPLSGREYVAAAATQAQVDTRITIRRRADLKPHDRVEHEGNFYDIRAILPDSSLRRHMTLMCQSGVNGG